MVKKIDKIAFFVFLILPAVLIFSWFRFGYIYGGGDTGLPTYNPQAMVNIAKDIWWDSLAPGIPVAQGLTSVPMLFLLSIPQILGAGPVFLQALLFFILLFLMGYGMYLLALSIFGKGNYLMALAAGVFYLFNPYMMVQIWHRFIHNSMVLVAFLPFLVLTWLLWIRKRNPLYLLLFLIVNFLAVYIYGTIAFIVAVWTLLILLTLLEGLIPWKGSKNLRKLFLALFIGGLFWLITNSWWLIPTFGVNPALFAEQHTTDNSLATLMELSSQTILPFTLRLINPFYLYWHADFGSIYQNPIFQSISWLFVIVVFIGLLKGLKQKPYISWSLLFLVLIFLAKGAAPPFNFPYIWGFSNFFPLGVIRNPFEKLGVLLPLVYALLFASGLQFLVVTSVKFIGKPKTILLLIIFICLHLAFFWPMFAGKLFGTLDKQNFVSVPKSYTQADEWIRKDLGDSKEGRILHLPLPRSEDVAYQWQYGYSGVEPSAAIFTSLPSIARDLNVPGVSNALSGLSLIFHKPNAINNQAVILKMLQDFSIKYVILHKDIEWKGGRLYNPAETESILDKSEFVIRQAVFDDLIIYKLKAGYFRPKLIISDNVQLLKSSKKNLFWPWIAATSSAEIISAFSNEQEKDIIDRVNKIIAFPENYTVARNLEVPKFKGSLDNFNTLRIPATSPLHFLIEVKEQLNLIGKSRIEQQQMKIIFAEKRLVEMYKIKRMRDLGIITQKSGDRLIISSVKKYEKLLNDIFKDELIARDVIIDSQLQNVLDVFLKHISLLEEFSESSDAVFLIKEGLAKNGLSPKYPLEGDNGLVKEYRQLYTFNIPYQSNYEILMNGASARSIYPNYLSELTFQINNIRQKFQEEDKASLMSFGKIEMRPGEYQISTPRLLSINLTPPLSGWNKSGNVAIFEPEGEIEMLSGQQSVSFIEGGIKPTYGGDMYQFGFDLKVLSRKGIRVQIIQDTDQFDKKLNKVNLQYDNFFVPVYFDESGWSHLEGSIRLNPTTQTAKLRIQAEPWDDCLKILNGKDQCLKEEIKKLYNRPSKFLIKNINIVRLFNNDIFLSANLPVNQIATSSGIVSEINRQSPGFYSGRIKITRPTFLFFKESFDPGWQLSLIQGENRYIPDKHLIANLFANAWLIEKEGDYDFTLSYGPQKFIRVGMLLAGLGWIIIIVRLTKIL